MKLPTIQRRRKSPPRRRSPEEEEFLSRRQRESERRRRRKSSRRGKRRAFFSRFSPRRNPPLAVFIIAVILIAAIVLLIVNKPKDKPKPSDNDNDDKAEIVTDAKAEASIKSFVYKYHKFDARDLLPYNGGITVLSFSPVVAFPGKAFDRDEYHSEIEKNNLTADEFRNILQELYDRGYILVSIDSVYKETPDANGSITVSYGQLNLPKNKKPLVLVFEDMDYTDVMVKNGFVEKLVIGSTGGVWDETVTEQGVTCISRENDTITILERFVDKHPDFSYNGAKGCIAVSGRGGIFGYDTQNEKSSVRQQAEYDAKNIIKQLKKSGWCFASNGNTLSSLSEADYADAVADLTAWVNGVGSVVGGTSVLVLPENGGRDTLKGLIGTDSYEYLKSLGFSRFFIFGSGEFSMIESGGSASLVSGLRVNASAVKSSGGIFDGIFDAGSVYDAEVRR